MSPVEGVVSIGAIFVIGLIAAGSTCMAVVGGLLLSVSAEWAHSHQKFSRYERIRPTLLFNAGRLVGYFVLGGLVGLLGTVLTLSSRSTGYLTVILSVVMVILGLHILRLIPKRYCRLPLSRSFQQKIHSLAHSRNFAAPMLLGALTFFLPCGFTQSMQLLALGSGSFLRGGMVMLTFALGTLPALLGISMLGSMVEGRWMRLFLRFSGALVLLLGILSLRSGLLLSGIDANRLILKTALAITGQSSSAATTPNDPYVSIADDGRQIITLYVSDSGYKPDSFTIEPGKETWVYAVAKNGLSGCANFLVSPTHNLSTIIRKGTNWLGPIKNPQRDFVLTCSMGRLRADVHVKKG